MIPIAEALRIVQAETRPTGSERVSISHAFGRILAEEIIADTDLPPFNRAQMDGYAVRASDVQNVPARLRIVG